MPTKPLWEQRQDETLKAYDTFRAYLVEHRPRPSLRKWCVINDVAYSSATLWKDQHDWEKRIAAYDAWLDQALDQERNKSLVLLQTQVVRDEVEDYQALRDTWAKAMAITAARVEKAQETGELDATVYDNLNKLAMARQRIDNMVRKSAQLPGQYASKEGGEVPLSDDADVLLDFENGPMMVISGRVRDKNSGGEISASSSVPDGSEELDGEVQGSGSGEEVW